MCVCVCVCVCVGGGGGSGLLFTAAGLLSTAVDFERNHKN